MNYTSAAIGIVTLLSMVTWFTTATERFSGPADVRELVVDGVEKLSAAVTTDTKVDKANG